MEDLQFCIARRKAELKAFVNVLKAMPQDRLDYRPDPRSRNAGDLARVIVAEEAALLTLLETGSIDWKEEPNRATVAELVASFERNSEAVTARLEKLDEAAWQKPAKFMMDGQVAWEDSVGQFLWGFLFDAIHHRGQLSAYLRPMGGKVPAIYGPSADDPGQ